MSPLARQGVWVLNCGRVVASTAPNSSMASSRSTSISFFFRRWSVVEELEAARPHLFVLGGDAVFSSSSITLKATKSSVVMVAAGLSDIRPVSSVSMKSRTRNTEATRQRPSGRLRSDACPGWVGPPWLTCSNDYLVSKADFTRKQRYRYPLWQLRDIRRRVRTE